MPAPNPPRAKVLAAYRYCEAVTALEARNFAYGIRLLPAPKRRAVSALYALARRVDDIGDGPLPADRKALLLEHVRDLLAEVREGAVGEEETDPVKLALADVVTAYPIPLEAFEELVDGVGMDVRGREYRTFAELREYCGCVAGSVGRLLVGVFGCTDPVRGAEYADALGLALQLTNILRDLREDAALGRSYLPAEDLWRFGCESGLGAAARSPQADVTGLVLFEAARAERYFQDGLRLLPLLDGRSRAATATMAGIYRRLLHRIARDPEAVLHGRIALPSHEKAWIAGSALARGAAPLRAA
ncbi:squalene/phytoene synthase family protein [Kitasatospora sp. NPDC094015]|uniref:phytoene/squalene synthase family protein n=1 Tax=Kitasatospora sp. NPDC094015 TaxID=3155205 RepID=UPI0033279E50